MTSGRCAAETFQTDYHVKRAQGQTDRRQNRKRDKEKERERERETNRKGQHTYQLRTNITDMTVLRGKPPSFITRTIYLRQRFHFLK